MKVLVFFAIIFVVFKTRKSLLRQTSLKKIKDTVITRPLAKLASFVAAIIHSIMVAIISSVVVAISVVCLFSYNTSLSAAGITSGLARLGWGGILCFSPMVTGIAVLVVLGCAVYKTIRYLQAKMHRSIYANKS